MPRCAPAPAAPPPRVSFYPYVDAKSIVREREGRIHLRLSDHLAAAPDQVLEGVVGILLARYFRLPDSRADAAACARTSSTSTTPAP